MILHDPIDKDWFDHLFSIRVKFGKYLTPNPVSVSEKAAWLHYPESMSPQFLYSALEKGDLTPTNNKIISLLENIDRDSTKPPVIKKIWLNKLQELRFQMEILNDVQMWLYNYSDRIEPSVIQEKLFQHFGSPLADVAELTFAELADRLANKGNKELLAKLNIYLPSKSYESYYRQFPHTPFPSNLELNLPHIENATELVNFLKSVLQENSLEKQWNIEIDTTHKYHRVQVFYKNRVLLIPSDQVYERNGKNYAVSSRKALRLATHEILTHIVRSSNGYNSKLRLLSVGLNKYLRAEEGLATFREQRRLGVNEYFAGFQSYLAVSLALGLDREGEKRSFREVYEILTQINLVLFHKTKEAAEHSAWKRLIRTYICHPINQEWIINPKDIVYREGNIAIHNLYCQNKYDDTKLNRGIYDPTNPIHLEALSVLNM